MGTLHNIQAPLFRALSKELYANDFVEGRFRLNTLLRYRHIVDAARQDTSEGYGHYKDKHGHDWNFEFGGRIYILCLSLPEVDLKHLRENMGDFLIQINNPTELAQDIERSLMDQGIKTFNGVHGGPVQYTKGSLVDEELDPLKRAFLSVTQKPGVYACDHEYRFFIILNDDPNIPAPEYINIDVGKSLNYVQLLQ